MVTLNQLFKKRRKKIKSSIKTLENCPQKKGICLKLILKAPKKPNSAIRKVAKVKLSNEKTVYCYIPGEGHNILEYSTILVRGGNIKDLPGVKLTLIRGKYDLLGVKNRKSSRSKYGTKKY